MTVRSISKTQLPLALRAVRGVMGTATRVSPELAASLAFRLWFRTGPRPRVRQDAREILAGAERRDLRLGNRRVAGYHWGDGPTVLLVHGWGGSAGQLAAFVPHLTGLGLRVAAIDLPAHGVNPGGRTHVFEVAEAIRHAAREWGPLHGAVTHSFGTLATLLAIRLGLPLERLVSLAPAVLPDTLVGGFSARLALAPAVAAGLRSRVRTFAGAGFWDDLAQPQPALIIHDVDDREVPISNADALWRAWPRATLRATRGLGHYRLLRDPDVIGEVTRFMDPASARAEVRRSA